MEHTDNLDLGDNQTSCEKDKHITFYAIVNNILMIFQIIFIDSL